MTGRELHWSVKGREFAIRIEESDVYVDGESTPFRILEKTAHGAVIEIKGQTQRVFVLRERTGCTVWWNGKTYRLERGNTRGRGTGDISGGASGKIHAPMPGKILRVEVQAGIEVQEKQALLVMESMKMETTIPSPKSGRVSEIRVQPGQAVEMGELLLLIE
jgi:biotin carboxyl carrier protein